MRKIKLFFINGLVITVISILLQLIGLSFGVYISNKIGKEAVGLFQLLMSIFSFGLTLALSGINLACIRTVSEEIEVNNLSNINIIMFKCLKFSLFFGILAFLLTSFFSVVLSKNILHNSIEPFTIVIMAIAFPFASICSCLNGYFSAVRHVIKGAFVQIIQQFLRILLVSCMLNYFFDFSINSACFLIVLGSSITEGITCIIMFFLYLHDKKKLLKNALKFPTCSKHSISKRIFNISVPISLATYIKSGLSALKQIVIPLKLEAFGLTCQEALSKYGLINGMVFPVILFPGTLLVSFSGLLIPEFSSFNVRGANKTIQQIINIILKYTMLFSFFFIGLFLVTSDELSILIYKNIEISKYIKILTPVIILIYLDNIVDGLLKGLNKQVSVMIINIIDLIFSILLISILVPLYGTFGYLIVIFISEFINCLMSLLVLINTTNIKFNFYLYILLPLVILFTSIFILNIFQILCKTVKGLIFNSLIYSAIYIFSAYIFKLISQTDFYYND